jgi:hypothetical protein
MQKWVSFPTLCFWRCLGRCWRHESAPPHAMDEAMLLWSPIKLGVVTATVNDLPLFSPLLPFEPSITRTVGAQSSQRHPLNISRDKSASASSVETTCVACQTSACLRQLDTTQVIVTVGFPLRCRADFCLTLPPRAILLDLYICLADWTQAGPRYRIFSIVYIDLPQLSLLSPVLLSSLFCLIVAPLLHSPAPTLTTA